MIIAYFCTYGYIYIYIYIYTYAITFTIHILYAITSTTILFTV